MLNVGNTLTLTKKVLDTETASTIGSGMVEVFSTPMLIAFMENAAYKLVQDSLNDGETTVGFEINAKHLGANLVGDEVVATATLTGVDGRKLDFTIEVKAKDRVVGTATHTRYVINTEKFMTKLQEA